MSMCSGLLRDNGIHVPNTSRYSLAPYHNHPLVKALTDYRRYSKLLSGFPAILFCADTSGYGPAAPKNMGRSAHTAAECAAGAEYPADSQEARFRSCFIAPEGRKLVLADYSQIELRVAAQISGMWRMRGHMPAGRICTG